MYLQQVMNELPDPPVYHTFCQSCGKLTNRKKKINNFPTSSALKQLLTNSLSPVIWKAIMPCKATCCEKIDLWPVAFILGTLGLVRADAKVQAASWNYLRNVWELFTSHHSVPFQSLFMCEQTGNKDFLLGLSVHPLVLYLCCCL